MYLVRVKLSIVSKNLSRRCCTLHTLHSFLLVVSFLFVLFYVFPPRSPFHLFFVPFVLVRNASIYFFSFHSFTTLFFCFVIHCSCLVFFCSSFDGQESVSRAFRLSWASITFTYGIVISTVPPIPTLFPSSSKNLHFFPLSLLFFLFSFYFPPTAFLAIGRYKKKHR